MTQHRYQLTIKPENGTPVVLRSQNALDDWESLDEETGHWLPTHDVPFVARRELEAAQHLLEVNGELLECAMQNAKLAANGALIEARAAIEASMALLRYYLQQTSIGPEPV